MSLRCHPPARKPDQISPEVSPPQARALVNDPAAGSPTATLLRLLLLLDGAPWSPSARPTLLGAERHLQTPRRATQSVAATGGVYKGQGPNQRTLMTYAY